MPLFLSTLASLEYSSISSESQSRPLAVAWQMQSTAVRTLVSSKAECVPTPRGRGRGEERKARENEREREQESK